MKRALVLIGIISLTAQSALAQSDPVEIRADTCNDAINKEVAKEHRLFRSVVFGQKEAADESIGTIRYGTDASAWYKTVENRWGSIDEETQASVWKEDEEMDSESELEPRQGLFETRRVLTSELIPPLGQSMRAFQCNLLLICDAARKSFFADSADPQAITAGSLGCLSKERPSIPECHLEYGEKDITNATGVVFYCESAVQQLLDQEADIINAAVEYDAAYRSLMQFAGNFDLFIAEFRWPFIHTVRNVVNLIGSLNRIPCFLSSCDASPLE